MNNTNQKHQKNRDKIRARILEEKEEFKRRRHWIKPIFVVSFLIIAQTVLFLYLYNKFIASANLVNWLWTSVGVVLVIYIINLDKPIDYRLAWIIPIAFLPLFGICLYFFLEIMPGPKRLRRRLREIKSQNMSYLNQDPKVHKEIVGHSEVDYGLDRYLYNIAGYPIYKNTQIEYFTQGEDYYKSLIEDLKKAEKFIFIEFFIIREGVMLDSIVDILAEKVDQGVEVRFLYDGINDYHLPSYYRKYLSNLGIDVSIFAPVLPIISTYHNNRDHRKIVSIDNKVAYTGGLNLADEYINEVEIFGHWKDNGIRLEGQAVRNMTVMFLNLWELSRGSDYDIKDYIQTDYKVEYNGYVQPFDDSPNDDETVGENVYVDVLNQAKDYVYMMTPYLIPSEKLRNALIFASKRGVDVRLMIPGIPDKKTPFAIARSYYENFLSNGVRIYEYRPGFLHSKSFVSDDATSVVGTVNLDFRSLHLHYENGVLIYDPEFACDLKKDFLNTSKVCQEINLEVYKELPLWYRLIGKMLRIFAPMM